MDKDEFLNTLERLVRDNPNDVWTFAKNDSISGRLRCHIPLEEQSMCPIEYVAYKTRPNDCRSALPYGNVSLSKSCQALGLDGSWEFVIMDAADGITLDLDTLAMRRRLLEITGQEE